MKKILILTSSDPRTRTQSAFLAAKKLASGLAENNEFTVSFERIQQIVFFVSASEFQAKLPDGTSLLDYDAVYVKRWHEEAWFGSVLVDFFNHHKQRTKLLNQEFTTGMNANKFVEAARFKLLDLPVCRSIFCVNINALAERAREELSFPFIFKSAQGQRGISNYLVKDETELATVVTAHQDELFIAQEFVPNDCDYRVLAFDFRPKLIIKRSRSNAETHLNNTSMGASAELVAIDSFDDCALATALAAARGFDLSVCGVDLLQNNETGQWHILEVNSAPDLTGTFAEEKAQLFAEYVASKV